VYQRDVDIRKTRRSVHRMRRTHDGDGSSTYAVGMIAVCGGVDIMDQE